MTTHRQQVICLQSSGTDLGINLVKNESCETNTSSTTVLLVYFVIVTNIRRIRAHVKCDGISHAHL